MIDPPGLGAVLRAHRRRAGLTQQEAADQAGLSVAALRDIEQGRVTSPRPRTLHRLGLALGLPAVEVERLVRRDVGDEPPVQRAWIGVLGPLVVRVDGVEVDPGSEVQRVLLGLLALSPNVPVARDRMLARMAAGRSGTTGGLAARMSRLRRRLRHPSEPVPAPTVVAADGGYALAVATDQLDLLTFRLLVRQARQHLSVGDLLQAWEHYARAVRLWRGEPLAGLVALADDPAVVGLVRQWPLVATEYAAVGAELGRHEEVVPVLRRVVAADPLHELAHARLMIALAGTARQAEALEVFSTLRRRLDRDLGAAPGSELVEAHRRVMRHEVPRPRTAAAPVRHTLPPDLAGFTGRAAELARLRSLLAGAEPTGTGLEGAGPARVVVLEGMPGVGKTRLAVHAAHRLVAEGRYGHQQLYADLAGQPEPAAVLALLLRLLGVASDQIPHEPAGREALYRERLGGGPTLVLLDGASSLAQVAPLVPAVDQVRYLVTSRDPLDLPGAERLRLRELSVAESTDLLVASLGADRVGADLAVTERVVELCGRLPLALVRAAGRLQARPAWTLADLAARLADPAYRLDELAGASRYGLHSCVRDYLREMR